MKTKIFNSSILTIFILSIASQVSFAQTAETVAFISKAPVAATVTAIVPVEVVIPPGPVYALAETSPTDSNYRKEMKKMQEQMNDLRKKMNDLRSEEYKKQALAMQEMSKKLNKSFEHFNEDNVSGGSKGMGVTVNGDDYVNKKIQTGDVKEKTKSFSKSYNVDGNDQIQIDNRYGKITVNTWNKREVKVDVQIKADADEESEAQKLLDGVSISDSKDDSGVSFRTNIESLNRENNFIGTWFKGGGPAHVRKIEVNYTVYMPAKSPLIITNRYGSTDLPELYGKVVINNSYGSLVAKTISNAGSEIKVRYGSARIDNLVDGDVDVAYGNLVIGESEKLNVDVSYGSAKIGRLKTSGNINARFSGTIQVADVDRGLKSLNVNSSYSSVKLGLGNDQNADFDITVKYGSFNYDGVPVSITSKTPSDDDRGFNPTKTYKGRVGKGNSDKVITIKSTFGSVKFD